MQRKSLPEQLRQVLEVSRYLALYMVASQPPQQFTFVDPLGNYFSVRIDNRPTCSCLPGNRDHCMHTFYVLSKIFRVKEDDPLLYQKQYSIEQLEEIYKGAKLAVQKPAKLQEKQNQKLEIKPESPSQQQIPKRKQNKKEQTRPVSNLTLKKQPKIQQPLPQPPPKDDYLQPKLQKGAVCSICYEPLQNQTPLLKCFSQCFSYFHIKCLRFWIDYQKKQEALASCPMCRAKLPENAPQLLKKGEVAFIKHYQSFEVSCSECSQEIRLKLFRCLQCPSNFSCQDCYFSWKHLSHDRYLMKKSKKASWSIPEPRAQASMAKLQASLQYVKQFKNQQEMKILFGQNYSKFLQSKLKKETLLEYLIGSFTSVSKQIYKTYKKLDYQEKDIKCMLCKKGKVTQMRRLGCKHFIDQKCLSFLLLSGERACPFDKTPFLDALPSLELTLTKK